MQSPIVPEEKNTLDDIDAEFEQLALELAQKKVDEAMVLQQNQLLPQKSLLERYKKEILNEFATYKSGQANGVDKLVLSLQELEKENPALFSDKVVEGINSIAGLSDLIAKDEQAFTEQMSRGGSLQEFAGVDDEVMDTLYQAAKRLYDQELFDDAADAFSFLTGLNHNNHVFWVGLGNAEYQRKHFKEALSAYLNVCEMTPNDPACHLTVSRCYVEIGEIDKAVNALDLCLAAIKESQECLDWKEGLEEEKRHLKQMHH